VIDVDCKVHYDHKKDEKLDYAQLLLLALPFFYGYREEPLSSIEVDKIFRLCVLLKGFS